MIGDWLQDNNGFPMYVTAVGTDYVYADFEEYSCCAYALLWCVENGHEPVGQGLF